MATVTASFTGLSTTTPSLSTTPSSEDSPSCTLSSPARRESRRDESHVRNMWKAAFVRMIGDEDVTGLDRLRAAIDLEDAAHEMAIDGRMKKHRRCHDQTPLSVQNHAAEIPRFADDRRIAGAVEVIVHFIDQARDFVA